MSESTGDSDIQTTLQRPYLLRAMHEWMTDNGETPLILVDAGEPDVQVPVEHIDDGHIVLNISWAAAHNLQLGNELVSFEARFSGVAHAVSVPMQAIKGIYARESGQGMMFQDEPRSAGGPERADADGGKNDQDSSSGSGRPSGPPDLRVIK